MSTEKRSYFARVTILINDEVLSFVTGITASDLNEAWAVGAARYTGEGSEWYPTAQLVSLAITPEAMAERVTV